MPRTPTQTHDAGGHWGEFPAISGLPNVVNSALQTNHVNIGDFASVLGQVYVCVSPAPNAAVWKRVMHPSSGSTVVVADGTVLGAEGGDAAITFSGDSVTIEGSTAINLTSDLSATGGFRTLVGPFTAPGAAGVTAASQTNLDCRYSHTVTAAALSYVATRAGSIMGISGQLSAAITGAGTTITISATVNGTEVACTAQFTQAGAETTRRAVVAKDTLAFAAGDIIGFSYTSTGISNTPALVGTVEIEQ